MFKLSKQSKSRCEGVDPRLIQVLDLAIKITLVDFGIPRDGGVRIAARQKELFEAGKSKCDGYHMIGKHQKADDGYGKAVDFYAYVDGAASWKESHLAMVACAMFQAASRLGYTLRWGGLWQRSSPRLVDSIPYGWDMGHIELVDY